MIRALAVVLALTALSPATPAEPGREQDATGGIPCAAADANRDKGELEKALHEYLDLLAADPSIPCAVDGAVGIERALRAEERLCKEGASLAASDQAAAARRRYARALTRNPGSSCASKGLAPATGEKEEKGSVETAVDDLTNFWKLAGLIAASVLVPIALLLLLRAWWQRRKPSLALEAFTDSAVEPKVGSGVTGLVEKRLNELSARRGDKRDNYALDVVATDVELVAANEGLETALGKLADVPQLSIAVAILGMLDRIGGGRHVVKGELVPPGDHGHGALLGLQAGPRLQAKGAIWDSGRPRLAPAAAGATAEGPSPAPYYGLVEPIAAWIQYEVARSVDAGVALITNSPKSFGLFSQALLDHRAERYELAAQGYGEALRADPGNVGALVNLSGLLARREKRFTDALILLIRAWTVLESRYEELE